MSDDLLERIRAVIQEDVNGRGLRTDPELNLINAFPNDFADACRSLARTADAAVGVLTGFFIPHATPPAGETDGPLGAIFLARALTPLGIRVALYTDEFCERAFRAGLAACGLAENVPLHVLSPSGGARDRLTPFSLTHFIALERVGPSHTPESLRGEEGIVGQFLEEVPPEHRGRCHTMAGRDITDLMAPAHRLVEAAAQRSPRVVSIGIGDGGNEIGMGKIPWDVIRRNIPRGGLIACRVPTDYLIVCGVSNWGAYGLAAGVRLLREAPPDRELFDPERERELLRVMVEQGPLVDGVTGRPSVSVDGLDFDRYAQPLRALQRIVS